MSAWERLARQSLVAWRAIALAQLLEELFARGAILREEAESLRFLRY